jgi:hypothetical protein
MARSATIFGRRRYRMRCTGQAMAMMNSAQATGAKTARP